MKKGNEMTDEEPSAMPEKSSKKSKTKETELSPQKVKELHEKAREDTARKRLIYFLNKAFWHGCQWLDNPDTNRAIISLPPGSTASKRREQATANKIQPAVHNMVSRTMKTDTTIEVWPGSADDFAQEGARLAESIARHKAIEDDHESAVKEKWITAAILGGTAAIVTDWDINAHRYSDDLATGDCKLTTLTLEDFVVEPGAAEPKFARWWIRRQILSPEAVKDAFGLPELPKPDADSSPYDARALAAYSGLTNKRGTEVLWYFERPNPSRPSGLVGAVVANEWALKPIPWPFSFKDRLNLEVGTCIEDPESWMGETPVTQALSVQRQINHILTKIHETNHRTVGAKLILDSRDQDFNKNLDDDPSTPVYRNAAAGSEKPEWLDPPKLPGYIIQALQELKEEFDNIMGVHAVSRGDTPSNSPESGYGISILAENDTTPVGRLVKEFSRVYANSVTNMLELYANKVKDSRQTRVVVGNGDGYFLDWTGEDLAGQTRAVVPPESTLPKSHAGMLKMATDMLNMRPDWFPTPSSWMRMARLPDVDDITESLDRDSALAKWENGRMRKGQIVQVNAFDDDAKHLQELHDEMKTPRFMALPKKIQEIFYLHEAAHKQQSQFKQGEADGIAARQQLALPADGELLLEEEAPEQGVLPFEDSGGEAFVPELPEGLL